MSQKGNSTRQKGRKGRGAGPAPAPAAGDSGSATALGTSPPHAVGGGAIGLSGAAAAAPTSEPSARGMKRLKYEGDEPMEIDLREELTEKNLQEKWIVDRANDARRVLGVLHGLSIYNFRSLYNWAASKTEVAIASTKLAQPFFSRILSKLVGSEQEIGSGPAANIKKFVEAYNRGQGIEEEESQSHKRAKTSPTYVEIQSFDELLDKYVMQADMRGAKFSFNHPHAQRTILGPLHNPKNMWPILSNSKLDMRFYNPGTERKSVAEDLANRIQLDETIPRLARQIVAVSGSGKTSTIFKVAQKHIVVYMQTAHRQSHEEVRKSRQPDKNYTTLYQDICLIASCTQNEMERTRMAMDRIATEYLARVLLLVRIVMDELKKKKKDQSNVEQLPSMFLAAQINGNDFVTSLLKKLGGIMTVAKCDDLLRRALNWLSDQKLKGKSVLQISGEERRLVLALDEIEAAAEIFKGEFVFPSEHDPKASMSTGNTEVEEQGNNMETSTSAKEPPPRPRSGSSPKQKKSLLSLLTAVACNEFGNTAKWTVVFAGTGSSHHRTTSLVSNIGKGEEGIDVINQSSFRSVTAADIRGVLSRLRLPHDVNLEELLPDNMAPDQLSPDSKVGGQQGSDSWTKLRNYLPKYVIGGRMRLLARAIEVLKKALTEEEKGRKQLAKEQAGDILLRAFRESVRQHLMDLVEHIKGVVISKSGEQNTLLRSLVSIYIRLQLRGGDAEFFGNTIFDGNRIDFTRLGLCGYTTIGVEGTRVYKMTERFAIEAIWAVFQQEGIKGDAEELALHKYMELLEELTNMYGVGTPSKGLYVEHILLQQLHYLSQDPNINSVADIPVVKEAVEKSGKTEFWKNVKFTVKSPAIVLAESIGSGPAATAGYLSNSENVGHIVSPEPVCRPDGVVMLEYGANKESRCAIFAGSAVYSKEVPKEKVLSQIRSTDPNLAYHKVDGSSNNNAKKARKAWENKGLHELKNVVRIHFNLPVAVTLLNHQLDEDTAASLEKGVIVNVDQTNLYQFFTASETFEKLRDLLAMATRTEKKYWATHPGSQ